MPKMIIKMAEKNSFRKKDIDKLSNILYEPYDYEEESGILIEDLCNCGVPIVLGKLDISNDPYILYIDHPNNY